MTESGQLPCRRLETMYIATVDVIRPHIIVITKEQDGADVCSDRMPITI